MTHDDLLCPRAGWARPEQPRLPPPPMAERGWLLRSLSGVSRLFGRASLPDIFPVLHRNRRLFWPWLLFASQLMPFGRLPATVREKAILRVAWNTRSRYEWGQHLELALKAGVSDAEILAMAGEANAAHTADDRLLLNLCDQLCADEPIDTAHWQAFSAQYDDAVQVELIMLVGHYRMIAGLLINAGIALEPPLEAVLAAFAERQAGPRV